MYAVGNDMQKIEQTKFLNYMVTPNRHLLAESQQLEHHNDL